MPYTSSSPPPRPGPPPAPHGHNPRPHPGPFPPKKHTQACKVSFASSPPSRIRPHRHAPPPSFSSSPVAAAPSRLLHPLAPCSHPLAPCSFSFHPTISHRQSPTPSYPKPSHFQQHVFFPHLPSDSRRRSTADARRCPPAASPSRRFGALRESSVPPAPPHTDIPMPQLPPQPALPERGARPSTAHRRLTPAPTQPPPSPPRPTPPRPRQPGTTCPPPPVAAQCARTSASQRPTPELRTQCRICVPETR